MISLWRTQGYTNKHSWPRGSSVSEFRLSADIPNDLSQNYNTKRWGGAGQSAAHRRGSSTGIYSLHTSSFSSWARQKAAETWLHLPGAVSAGVHTDNVRAKVLFVGGSQPPENAQPMELGKAGQQLQKSQSTCTHPPSFALFKIHIWTLIGDLIKTLQLVSSLTEFPSNKQF